MTTASTATAPSSSLSAVRPNAANPIQPKAYLAQCAESLDLKTGKQFAHHSKMWNVALAATAIVHLLFHHAALFVGVSLTTAGLLGSGTALVVLPCILIPALLVIPAIFFYNHCIHKADENRQKADFCRNMCAAFNQIQDYSADQMQQFLISKEVEVARISNALYNPARMDQIKPLVARLMCHHSDVETLQTRKNAWVEKVQKMQTSNAKGSRRMELKLHVEIAKIDHQMAMTKVNAAFVQAVIYNPEFASDASTVFEFTKVGPQTRALRNSNGIASAEANQFVHFKKAGIAAITVDDIRRSSIQQLSLQILQAL